MTCSFCKRKLSKNIAKRFNHYAVNHPNMIAGYGLRIAANPYAFGKAAAEFLKKRIADRVSV